jgi:uncharacterized membrane protein YphA (DoxX/SURF4 family)
MNPFTTAQRALDSTRVLDFLGPLALRLYLVPVFWMSGTQKLTHIEATAQWFDATLGLPFPLLMAWLAALAETLGAVSLLTGFAVRWMSIPLMVTMVVAAFTVHWSTTWEDPNAYRVTALYQDGGPVETLSAGSNGQVVLNDSPMRVGEPSERPEDPINGLVHDVDSAVLGPWLMGETGDRGRLSNDAGDAFHITATRAEDSTKRHEGQVEAGELSLGEPVRLSVDKTPNEVWLAIASDDMVSKQRLERFKSFLRSEYPGRYGWVTERGNLAILNNGIEFAGTYLVMLLALFFIGAGRFFSLDYWLAKLFKRD